MRLRLVHRGQLSWLVAGALIGLAFSLSGIRDDFSYRAALAVLVVGAITFGIASSSEPLWSAAAWALAFGIGATSMWLTRHDITLAARMLLFVSDFSPDWLDSRSQSSSLVGSGSGRC